MAIGASYAGARAMTATAGGGFALMVESVSLSGMIEVPLVIVVGQRPGPATGLPTRTSQADLLFVIHAGHGEFPKMVVAPSDPLDAFHKTVESFNLADKYQIPVIIMTNQYLADSAFSFESFPFQKIIPEKFIADPQKIESYKRYQITKNGVSQRLYPGQSRHLVAADSDEHDEYGHITEDLSGTVIPMVKKRLDNMKELKKEIAPPEHYRVDQASLVLVGWGSSRNAIVEAIELLEKDGIRAGMIHFTQLWPLPIYDFVQGKQYYTVEENACGQLGRLLRAEYNIEFHGHIGRFDGLPLTANYIRSRML
jgi:2-oxoglutarate ferredoxin oxidoreductase subunit alpha